MVAPEIYRDRIWIDGCFDFAHHGHAGAMLQARQLGHSLYVGVHSDEEILENKGPVVMTLPERILAVEACKWATQAIPSAPYVTSPKVMDEYGCFYVVHGDDITTDANGEDCYRVVKNAGRFLVVKRTPNISTTDLVGRMLLCTKNHHIKAVSSENVEAALANARIGKPMDGLITPETIEKFRTYATGEDGKHPRDGVFIWTESSGENHDTGMLTTLVEPSPKFMQTHKRMIYVDGGFDLFFAGHIEFLRLASQSAADLSRAIANGTGTEIGIVVGIHSDATVNAFKPLNYPIMSLFERALCVLQCKFVSHVVLQAPYCPTQSFLDALPWDIDAVMHGPTRIDTEQEKGDPYAEVKRTGLYREIGDHKYKDISTETIVERVTRNRGVYEERQRRKGWKSDIENELKSQEESESS
ncbi:hypothetical protein V1525DRAFT_373619 [Lipomyces kononenkoae]|uniref:Uncharacterized protein n=1 Tax=Lipomyces kononenkoae TaxID=34357 RepID=A0ACC3T4W5_LIPKO